MKSLPRCGFLLILLLLAGCVPVTLAAQEDDNRALRWRELAVDARLDADGRLRVRERHAMVFDGAWNGGEREFDLRLGQELRLNSLARIDPETGARTPLRPGDLDQVDRFDWTDRETLRWRSRLATDPPFQAQEIVYELDYTLWPVLTPDGDGYLLRHDFAFPDRAGVIERFQVDLALDAAWAGPAQGRVREGADLLQPGRGYVIRLPLRHVAAGAPGAVPVGAPAWARGMVTGGALLVPLMLLAVLHRRSRALDRAAPPIHLEEIDEPWLQRHIFAYPAEVVGTAWDRSVGQAEVAALLARLVAEGKLASRVEASDQREPVLHLRRVAPMDDFAKHERSLLDALFFSGSDQTHTQSLREHYEKEGFDPAARIRKGLMAHLDELPGPGRRARPWPSALLVLMATLVLVAIAAATAPGGALLTVLALLLTALTGVPALICASLLAWRVARRGGLTAGVVLSLFIPAVLLAGLASGALEGRGAFVFFRPNAPLLFAYLGVLASLGLLAAALSRSTETTERVAFRRRMTSAREHFQAELRRPQPRLQDAWFPYLLAFGLGPHVDRWFRSFGGWSGTDSGMGHVWVASHASSGGSAASGWTGGGPQFGGGSFGGGGAGGTWSVAVGGIASGVAAPSSSGSGGGGGSASGGGGGGGW